MNQKVIDYCIVDSGFASGLGPAVASKILNGWQPFGSPYHTAGGGYHCQAMVKYA